MGRYMGVRYNLSADVHEVLDAAGAHLAAPREYANWVAGHLRAHPEDQAYSLLPGLHREEVHVITRDVDLPPLYGQEALTLLVPHRIHVRHRGLGDTRLFYMEDFFQDTLRDHTIRLDAPTLRALRRKHIGPEDFIYAEARALNRSFRGAAGFRSEQMLGLISAGIREWPDLFSV
jgi:hypothetical protein